MKLTIPLSDWLLHTDPSHVSVEEWADGSKSYADIDKNDGFEVCRCGATHECREDIRQCEHCQLAVCAECFEDDGERMLCGACARQLAEELRYGRPGEWEYNNR